MKHLGNRSEFTERKREELLQAYMSTAGEENFAQSESSRFWVSEDRAAIVMRRMENGDPLDGMNKEKRLMYYELYRRMQRLRKKHPDISASEAMREIIYTPAPSFYIARATAERTVRNMIAERRRKRLALASREHLRDRKKEEMLRNAVRTKKTKTL